MRSLPLLWLLLLAFANANIAAVWHVHALTEAPLAQVQPQTGSPHGAVVGKVLHDGCLSCLVKAQLHSTSPNGPCRWVLLCTAAVEPPPALRAGLQARPALRFYAARAPPVIAIAV